MEDHEEVINELAEIKNAIFELSNAIGKLEVIQSSASDSPPPASVDAELLIGPLAVQIEKTLVSIDKKVYTLFEIQKNDNKQMAESLNAILEKIYDILERWGAKVSALESTNAIVDQSIKDTLNDIITPTLKNITNSMRREIVNENRIANELLAKTVLESLKGTIQTQPQRKEVVPAKLSIKEDIPLATIAKLTVVNTIGIVLLLIKAILH